MSFEVSFEEMELMGREGLLNLVKQQSEQVKQLSEQVKQLSEKPQKQSESPSMLGKQDEFLKTYEKNGIYCNVPQGAWRTHPGLYFKPFSTFSTLTLPDNEDLQMKFSALAAKFVYEMTAVYPSEEERIEQIHETLAYFDRFRARSFRTNKYRTDITILQSKRRRYNDRPCVLANIEVKNGLGMTNSDANLQNVNYYKCLVPQEDRCGINPLLLISMVGCDYLQAFGAILTETKEISCSPLGPPLSMLYEHRVTSSIDLMAIFWYKVEYLLNELDQFYTDAEIILYPYYFGNEFTHIKMMRPGLYKCTYNEQQVVVKFTRSYGTDVHEYMYQSGFAPKLIDFTKLDGGWIVVLMEFVDGDRVQKEEAQECKHFIEAHILPKLQEKNYVHGDLRLSNIIRFNKKFIVIDYDWAGTNGEARFPVNLLQWPKSVNPGGFITNASDIETVQMMEKLC